LGIGLVIAGTASLGIIFNPKGIPTPFADRLTFILVMFAISVTIGFGGWLFSQYPLKMFLKVILGFTLWTFLFFLPIFLSSLPTDVIILSLSSSLLLLALLSSYYSKWRAKQKKDAQKEEK